MMSPLRRCARPRNEMAIVRDRVEVWVKAWWLLLCAAEMRFSSHHAKLDASNLRLIGRSLGNEHWCLPTDGH